MIDRRVKDIAWAIEQNPVEVTIYRTTRILSDGHYSETKEELGPYRVRIFLNQSGFRGTLNEVKEIGGRALQSVTWSMLCDASVDIKAGANVVDIVEAPMLGKLKVTNVTPLIVNGQIVGYQVQLEGMDE